ncbi:MAG TPA: hypothetical protein VFU43_28150 [Streptosporangiaceae bacterium]|nr:hypothetical protein [Streptosporangiaceae bacterium]
MDDVRAAGPARPNLWAGGLTSYAFSVEATIGQNPMRYLVGRRFEQAADNAPPTGALTMLFVIRPQVLYGTYVRISESAVGGGCEIHTFLPTMARPVKVAEALMFDCLPLTDVGYLDLMAWPHPGLRAVGEAAYLDPAADITWTPTTMVHYAGPSSVPGLRICDVVDVEFSMVIRRVLYRDGRQVRRWEITERGAAGEETLPARIRVARPQTGHGTEFVRASPAIAVPPDVFDGEPAGTRAWIGERLPG